MNRGHIDLTNRRLNGSALLGDGMTLSALGLWPFWGTAIALQQKIP